MPKELFYVALFIFLVFDIYLFSKILFELKRKNFIGNKFKSFNEKYEQRQIEKETRELYEGSLEETELIEKIDNLFNRSNIKEVFPFMTPEILVTATLVTAVLVSVITTIISGFWLYVVAAFSSVILAVLILLKFMSRVTFDKIDNQMLSFIDTLENFSTSSTGITSIFQKSIPYTKSPIKDYLIVFDAEAKSAVPLENSFKNFRKKVENNRLKKLLNNLEVCSLHNENYPSVLENSSAIFNGYFSEKRSWSKDVFRGRKDIIAMAAVGMWCFYELGAFVDNKNIIEILRTTVFGNVLLGYFLAVLLYAIYKLFTLDKFNF